MARSTADSGAFEFRSYEPEGELRRLVELVWFARGRSPAVREQIAPTGSTVAAFVLGDPIMQTPGGGRAPFWAETGFLIGPHDRPLGNEPSGLTHCYGIVTTPIGCRPVLTCDPRVVRGHVVDLLHAWPAAAGLRAALLDVGDGDTGVDLICAALSGLRVPVDPGVVRAEAVVARMTEDPSVPVGQIAADLGISHGHLDRQFSQAVGLNPRTLARILRVRRLLDELDVSQPIDWSAIALRHGWFDQAHLIRDFRRHTGVAPSSYVRAQRAVYAPGELASSAGFVPEA